MNKKRIFYIALVVIAAVLVSYFYLYKIYFQEPNEIDRTYAAEDFPTLLQKLEEGRITQEVIDYSIEDLNKQYSKLREGDHIYIRWINVGILKKRFDDFEGAEKAWLTAVDYAPEQSLGYGNLADLYLFTLGEYEKAEEYYLKVLELRKDNYTYYIGLAALYRYNMTEKAHLIEGIINEGASINPAEAANYYLYLADYYARDGENIEKAKLYANKVIELDPESRDQLPSYVRDIL